MFYVSLNCLIFYFEIYVYSKMSVIFKRSTFILFNLISMVNGEKSG